VGLIEQSVIGLLERISTNFGGVLKPLDESRLNCDTAITTHCWGRGFARPQTSPAEASGMEMSIGVHRTSAAQMVDFTWLSEISYNLSTCPLGR
jgi:hypothetical protein